MSIILITAELFGELSHEPLLMLENAGFKCRLASEIETHMGGDEDALVEAGKDAVGLLVSGRARLTRRVLTALGRLKVISRRGVGTDNIDLEACRDLRIVVATCPEVVSRTVADHAMMLVLALAKNLVEQDKSVRSGLWRRDLWSAEVWGQTLGLVGLGRIGQSLAHRARGFEMRILAYDPYADRDFPASHGIEIVPLDLLLQQSDFVSLHAPLTPDSRRMIGARELSLMKTSAFLINTSRGALVDQAALIRALESGTIAGAGLDTLEQEPPSSASLLLSLSNTILTPHAAGNTSRCWLDMEITAARNLISSLSGSQGI